jgi:hypothetical protein
MIPSSLLLPTTVDTQNQKGQSHSKPEEHEKSTNS